MRTKRRSGVIFALVATVGLAASGCSSADDESPSGGGELYKNPVVLNWWHNANQAGPLQTYWQKVADDFHKLHPTVTIKITPIETNELQRNRIPAALLSSSPPEIFEAWGGGEMVEQVKSDYLKDITAETKAEVGSIGAATKIWSVDGKQYGLPFSFGIEGFWYNKDLFTKAGISAPPTTLDELNAAVTKLKAANITPIAVGAGDKWPAAHWWYNLAVRECAATALSAASSDAKFDDPCFVKAGEDLKTFLATTPFQKDFLATSGQVGATSSAGLLANGKAAMELMGHWNGGTMQTLTPDQKEPKFLGWFPFPSVTGAGGSQKTMMGGGDGFSCSKKAPAECVEFLKYIVSLDVQKGFAATGSGIPTVKGAESGLADPVMQTIAQATQSAEGVQLWLDTAFGAKAGTAMNDAIIAIFADKGTPQGVVDALKKATAR
ncbi:extracellular solute-binding protein [Hamadaea sp. NPDC051192]|uniref:ABC transporter substrate-binding protein n=1 Tax=Hamadaea sp. NPDC051192 TaxID=3154940 RepID=UPI00342E90F6